MKNQTWWDAACNLNPNNVLSNWWGCKAVTNWEQFNFLIDIGADTATPEESFLFLCFMSEAFDHDQ